MLLGDYFDQANLLYLFEIKFYFFEKILRIKDISNSCNISRVTKDTIRHVTMVHPGDTFNGQILISSYYIV